MKNWISLAIVAGLITGCGALKHQKNAGATAAKSNVDTSTQAVAAVVAATPALPALVLNNLETVPSSWTSPSGKSFSVIGKISKQDASNLVGANEETIIALGNISITREKKIYNSTYNTSDFLPTTSQVEEDHPEIAAYLAQTGDPAASLIFISQADFVSLAVGDTPITIQYDQEFVCWKWKVNGVPTDPELGWPTICSNQDSVVTCQSYGVCSSSCANNNAIFNSNPGNAAAYFATGMQISNPNCMKKDEWLTKSISLTNIEKISEYRIHPATGSAIPASMLTLPGDSI